MNDIYTINVAKVAGPGWDGKPKYVWFCTIQAGHDSVHAQQVADAVKNAFPAPEHLIALRKRVEHFEEVDNFAGEVY